MSKVEGCCDLKRGCERRGEASVPSSAAQAPRARLKQEAARVRRSAKLRSRPEGCQGLLSDLQGQRVVFRRA